MIEQKKFQDLINEHAAILNKVCRLYTDTEEDFDDYYQEIAIQLWKSYAKFRGDSKLSTWVYQVAINTCLSQLRKKKRRPEATPIDGLFDLAEPENDHIKDERLGALYQAIKRLKEIDRALILLYLEDKSYKEITEILGLSMSNVGVKINRVKTQLKQMINGNGK
ncbi:MAG: RNA polymerase sigma factor [Bacteroidota bacterium]